MADKETYKQKNGTTKVGDYSKIIKFKRKFT